MAYAYNTLANGGARISGTEASQGNGKGPVAIDKVVDQDDKPVPDNLGGSGENEKVSEQVIDPAVAQTATDILHTVVTSGTGERAQVGDDYIWGKTGTTDNNADAWFVGANEDITVAVWVGYPDGATPMETEFGGLPVDGGTIPALIWNQVVTRLGRPPGVARCRGRLDRHDEHDRHLRAAGHDRRPDDHGRPSDTGPRSGARARTDAGSRPGGTALGAAPAAPTQPAAPSPSPACSRRAHRHRRQAARLSPPAARGSGLPARQYRHG